MVIFFYKLLNSPTTKENFDCPHQFSREFLHNSKGKKLLKIVTGNDSHKIF